MNGAGGCDYNGIHTLYGTNGNRYDREAFLHKKMKEVLVKDVEEEVKISRWCEEDLTKTRKFTSYEGGIHSIAKLTQELRSTL